MESQSNCHLWASGDVVKTEGEKLVFKCKAHGSQAITCTAATELQGGNYAIKFLPVHFMWFRWQYAHPERTQSTPHLSLTPAIESSSRAHNTPNTSPCYPA